MLNIGTVILAAGGSTRLGTPKQLIKGPDGISLIRIVCTLINSIECKQKWIVLGANHESIQSELHGIEIPVIINPEWKSGIASSIKIAVEVLTKKNDLDGLMFVVCDQPYLNKKILDAILYTFQNTSRYIVASKYKDVLGTPALFHSSFFPELLKLSGDKGAGKIIYENLSQTAIIRFEEGIVDIDTREDYNRYLDSKIGQSDDL